VSTLQAGPDEVILTRLAAPAPLCNSRACASAGRAADLLVTYGSFGSYLTRTQVWPELWGHTYPNCTPCWEQARAVLARARPALTVHQAAP
jgi:hypothetical protein